MSGKPVIDNEVRMDFNIIINNSYVELFSETTISPSKNKHILSFANDFEDGLWRHEKFQEYVWNNIAETALSSSERENLVGSPHSILRKAAKNLRLIDQNAKKKIGEGSELAEIVLYGIMRKQYSALPVVPKIFYKQNSQDTVKGADSVHIVVNADGSDFTLWFGEAKFLNDISDSRLDKVVESVKESLNTEKLKKENSIITSVQELEGLIKDSNLYQKIKESLSGDTSIDLIKPKINIPILLLHECDITKTKKEFNEAYVKEITAFHKDRAKAYFSKQVGLLKDEIFKYSDITFHLILFPVPNKQVIVDQFVKNVMHYKE
jgi:hypothetical protein